MLKEEIKKIISRKQFVIVFLIFFFTAIGDFLLTCKVYYGIELSWVRSAYKCGILTNEAGMFTGQFYSTLLPILVCIGVSDVYYTERTSGITNFIYSRTTHGKNILTKIAAVSITSFLMVFIPLVINFLLVFTAFPLQGYYCTNSAYLTLTSPEEGRIFGYLEMFYPYLNSFVYILIRCLIGTSFALFSFSISLINNFNRYIVLFSGMIFYLCYTSATGLPFFVETDINTNIFSVNGYGSGWMFLVFIGIQAILSMVMTIYGMKREIY